VSLTSWDTTSPKDKNRLIIYLLGLKEDREDITAPYIKWAIKTGRDVLEVPIYYHKMTCEKLREILTKRGVDVAKIFGVKG